MKCFAGENSVSDKYPRKANTARMGSPTTIPATRKTVLKGFDIGSGLNTGNQVDCFIRDSGMIKIESTQILLTLPSRFRI
jgi:hypothetical protein